jgi:hypothetical protein
MGRCQMAQATASIFDAIKANIHSVVTKSPQRRSKRVPHNGCPTIAFDLQMTFSTCTLAPFPEASLVTVTLTLESHSRIRSTRTTGDKREKDIGLPSILLFLSPA